MVPLSYNVRNLMVRKTTTFATALGLGLVVFVFAAALMLVSGLKKTLGRSGASDVSIAIRKGSENELSSGIEEPNVKLIVDTAGPGATAVAELIDVILLDNVGSEGVSIVQVRGVPDNAVAFRPTAKITEGRAPKPGADEVLVGKGIRGRFKGTDIGQTFELKKNRPVTVVGVLEDQGSSFESEIWADVNTVRTAFGREGMVSSVRVRLSGATNFDTFKATAEQNKQLAVQVFRETDYLEKQSEMTAGFLMGLGVLIALFFSIGAMIGATITMHAAVASRQREVGTLRALGFSRTQIMISFLFESLVLSLFAGVMGGAASLLLGFVRFATMNFATGSEIVFTFEPTPPIVLGSMFMAAVMGIMGGFFPALRAARISPVAAMRG